MTLSFSPGLSTAYTSCVWEQSKFAVNITMPSASLVFLRLQNCRIGHRSYWFVSDKGQQVEESTEIKIIEQRKYADF